MPTLDELRRMLQEGVGETKARDVREGKVGWGDDEVPTDHLDTFAGSPGVDPAKMRKSRGKVDAKSEKGSPPRYTPSTDGRDATINFGKHRGKTIGQIATEEPDYLAWLIKEFSEHDDIKSKDFVDIVRYRVRLLKDPKTRPPMPRTKGETAKSKKGKPDFAMTGEPPPVIAEFIEDGRGRRVPAIRDGEEKLKLSVPGAAGAPITIDADGGIEAKCPRCRGTGDAGALMACPACKGKGRIEANMDGARLGDDDLVRPEDGPGGVTWGELFGRKTHPGGPRGTGLFRLDEGDDDE